MKKLPDVQKNKKGFYRIPINKVGVRNIIIPFKVLKKSGGFVYTNAKISSYCDLVESIKGINMSRISRSINETLSETKDGFSNLNTFVKKLQKIHQTKNVFIRAKFNYTIKDKSPVTDLDSLESVTVIFESTLEGKILRNYLTVRATEMSLCPCSKEMSLLSNNITAEELETINKLPPNLKFKIMNSGFGAHNQKSKIEVKIEINEDTDKLGEFWIEDLIKIIRAGSSCTTFTTLKRPDEKYITEVSYMGGYFADDRKFIKVDNSGPKFVEDIARDISYKLNQEINIGKRILDYLIIVNNEESIHSGDITATAILNAGKELK